MESVPRVPLRLFVTAPEERELSAERQMVIQPPALLPTRCSPRRPQVTDSPAPCACARPRQQRHRTLPTWKWLGREQRVAWWQPASLHAGFNRSSTRWFAPRPADAECKQGGETRSERTVRSPRVMARRSEATSRFGSSGRARLQRVLAACCHPARPESSSAPGGACPCTPWGGCNGWKRRPGHGEQVALKFGVAENVAWIIASHGDVSIPHFLKPLSSRHKYSSAIPHLLEILNGLRYIKVSRAAKEVASLLLLAPVRGVLSSVALLLCRWPCFSVRAEFLLAGKEQQPTGKLESLRAACRASLKESGQDGHLTAAKSKFWEVFVQLWRPLRRVNAPQSCCFGFVGSFMQACLESVNCVKAIEAFHWASDF